MNSKIITSKPVWENGISLIRICAGIMIIMFGKEIFDEATMNDYTKFLTDVGFSSPRFMLTLAKLTELIGGAFLIVGLFTRIVVLPLMMTMSTMTTMTTCQLKHHPRSSRPWNWSDDCTF